ncbi:MAG TPA: hypothetical protein DEO38_04160 [Bacteroidales bacterium]|nr:hypothetical protein [Bacteroidales bacterium]
MKNIAKKIICAAFMLCWSVLSYAQAPSTEGVAFWLSFMQNESDSKVDLSINVSAKRACTLTIVNPNTSFTKSYNLQAGLNEIEQAATPLNECYNNNSESVNNKALYITSTDTISLFASNYQQSVFDNAAILPEPALRDDYIVQTYPNSEGKKSYAPEFLIVATENGTIVDITPTFKTKGGKNANQSFNVTLNRGQSYQVQTPGSAVGEDLSGSIIKARNGKKIAVFNGNRSEAIPYGEGTDGDHIFEQAMPVAYWGTEFVLTRTMDQLAAIFRITAKNNNTDLTLNGRYLTTLSAGETYQYQMTNPEEVAYLETSCPAAVYMYLTSGHKFPGAFDGAKMGGPASVWVSPIEQMIKEVNFATDDRRCKYHYVNIVTLTPYASSVTLTGKTNGAQQLSFVPVPNHEEYSFTKVAIPHDSYKISSARGVIAYVYGLGKTESYAYSAGSSVKVTNGISINDEPFSTEEVGHMKSCFGDVLRFNSSMKDVSSIEWDMADGVTLQGTEFEYTYDAPGIYDVECYIHRFSNPCDGSSMEDTIFVQLEVNVPVEYTRYTFECEVPEDGDMWHPQTMREYTEEFGCDSIVHKIAAVNYSAETSQEIVAEDEYVFDGQKYTSSVQLDKTWKRNLTNCDSIVHYDIKIVTCLHMEMYAPEAPICTDYENAFQIPYTVSRGEYSGWEVEFDAAARAVGFSADYVSEQNGSMQVMIPETAKPGHYVAHFKFFDMYECYNREFEIPFTINFPVSIAFAQKWDDVLAAYNSKYNGGYTFTSFQWFKNDMPIPGATGSYYYAKVFEPLGILEPGAVYSLQVTTREGVTYMSCEHEIPAAEPEEGGEQDEPTVNPNEPNSDVNIEPEQPIINAPRLHVAPTSAVTGDNVNIVTNQDCDVTIYNVVGMPVENYRISAGTSYFKAPAQQGNYMIKARFNDGTSRMVRMIVR